MPLSVNNTQKQIKSDADFLQWEYLSRGNFNDVYIDSQRKNVLKCMTQESVTDQAARAVMVWNKINPGLEAQQINEISWVCPYIEGIHPSDEDIALELISIYNRTRYIVVDADHVGNFIKSASGNTICVDVGMALIFSHSPAIFKISQESLKASKIAWAEMGESMVDYFPYAHKKHPLTTEIIQSLLFITQYYPGIVDSSFLLEEFITRTNIVSLFSSQTAECFDKLHPDTRERLFNIERAQLRNPLNQPSFGFSFLRHNTFFYPSDQQAMTSWKTSMPQCHS